MLIEFCRGCTPTHASGIANHARAPIAARQARMTDDGASVAPETVTDAAQEPAARRPGRRDLTGAGRAPMVLVKLIPAWKAAVRRWYPDLGSIAVSVK
jgi:hypothetical protein